MNFHCTNCSYEKQLPAGTADKYAGKAITCPKCKQKSVMQGKTDTAKQEWFVHDGDKERGPLDYETLKAQIENGWVQPDFLIKKGTANSGKWQRASTIDAVTMHMPEGMLDEISCPECSATNFSAFSCCSKCGESLDPRPDSENMPDPLLETFNITGLVLIVGGVLIIFLAFVMKTTASSGDSEVYNMGLQQQQMMTLVLGVTVFATGVALYLFGFSQKANQKYFSQGGNSRA